jgi:glycosyltransferase involved in cell wall biosynthesis
MTIGIFAYSLHSSTFSGGDTIFVECAKRWIKAGHRVMIFTHEAGKSFCMANGIGPSSIWVMPMSGYDTYGFSMSILYKTREVCKYFEKDTIPQLDAYFATSFFFPDLIPAIIAKKRFPTSKLLTAFYINSKTLFGMDYSGGPIKGLFFYINEQISILLTKWYGSYFMTASARDRDRFVSHHHLGYDRVTAIRGGVDNKLYRSVPEQEPKFHAIFMGRFHPQKCIDELLMIWQQIMQRHPDWRLGLIGDGILMDALHVQVTRSRMEKNVFFLGMLAGVQKVQALKSSRVFLSASRYDTGNIALDEALACGVPGVIYDLPDLDYPFGVMKIPVGDSIRFSYAAEAIIVDDSKRDQLSSEALSFAATIDWDVKANDVIKMLQPEQLKK